MSTTESLKDFGGVLAGLAIMAVIAMIGVMLLVGAAELSLWALEWAPSIFGGAFLICAMILLPLAIFPATRGFAGNGLYVASYVFGLIMWVLAMAFVYVEWGLFAVIVGIVLAGIGIVPIAFLATIVEGQWTVLGNLALLVVLTVGLRVLGYWLVEKAAERAIRKAAAKAQAEVKIRPYKLD